MPCDDRGPMLSEANREIRRLESEAGQRRQRQTVRAAVRYLDALIDELEHMNLAGIEQIPRAFFSDLREFAAYVPGWSVPSDWPPQVARAIDHCFELQERLFAGQFSRQDLEDRSAG